MTLPEFALETYLARWEFTARYNLTASDGQAVSLARLLELADPADRAEWENLSLGYTPVRGAPALREAIAGTYDVATAADIMTFVPGEAITTVMRALLGPDDHVVTVLPNYQSAETVPRSICEVTGVPLRPDDGWDLDIEAVATALRPNTRLVAVNFPNNPTGSVASRERWLALAHLLRARGCYLFSDEIYRGVEHDQARTLPQAADLYERGISLGGLSKTYGLPGLRIGWIACRDPEVLDRAERVKHYGSICAAAPSEVLARIAIKARDTLLAGTRDLLARNRPVFAEFFARHADRFSWSPPDGGCVCYPRYLGPDGVDAFCRAAVTEGGVLLLPASVYASPLAPLPADRFRVGIGRADAPQALAALEEFLARRG
ncbi:MAG TPA: aminotransferase class I/II-fold pyridoxal phosphate-dependent enzyme [Streptosporangiaceae bacterium]|nr:aminotransferase class I/II-fold pyridoxal phosphate-dependent enzyme [Streptosporangiaceae bacterium]